MAVLNLFVDEPGWTNQERAEMAARAAVGYAEAGARHRMSRPADLDLSGIDQEDIIDLLSDLCHLADQLDLSVPDTLQAAFRHYLEEKYNEPAHPEIVS